MKTKSTDELFDTLLKADHIDTYLKADSGNLIDRSISSLLTTILEKKGLVKSDVIHKTEMSEVMGYQIFSGVRKPSRDSLISICIAMQLTLDEAQEVLKHAGFGQLYPRNVRDSILIHGIHKKQTVPQINEVLFDHGEKTLNQ